MAAIRRAEVTWDGDLLTGSGTVSAVSSGAFTDLPVSWAARTEAPEGKTSPEELIAAAHASCFAMAFSADLGRAPAVVVASEPMDEDPGWRAIPSGHLVHVAADLTVTSASVLDAPPAHPLTLADLGATAAASQRPSG